MDITQLLKTIDLQILAEQAGARFNGRHSSCCPLHNGNNPNAFHIYYGQDGIQRYHCFTNCPEGANGGNAIGFYMRWRQVDFKTAVADLSRMFNVQVGSTSMQAERVKPSEIDPAPVPPSDQWKARASAFVSYTHDQLWNDNRALCYLMGRGLTEDTIGAFGLGLNPRDLSDRAEQWGLDGKLVWLPRGIVIPHKRSILIDGEDGSIWFVNIRRPVGTPKYMGPRGGVRGIYHGPLGPFAGLPVLLLAEGEFDTMLAWQSANDLCDMATLGGARHRVDVLDASGLMRYAAIICAYDLDKSGESGSEYLRSAIGARISVAHPDAHDLTDYWKAGGDLRRWIAGRIVEQIEILIGELDEYQQPELFCKWLAVYQRALDAR